jgi:hypothetical protein
MKPTLTIIALTSLIITGCYSTDPNGDKPIRYASSVQVAPYDSIQRAPSATIEVFQDASAIGNRPYHVIALLTREGYPNDEGLITSALIWRAKHIGANGIILLNTSGGGQQSFAFGNANGIIGSSSPGQIVFRADAIVFDK